MAAQEAEADAEEEARALAVREALEAEETETLAEHEPIESAETSAAYETVPAIDAIEPIDTEEYLEEVPLGDGANGYADETPSVPGPDVAEDRDISWSERMIAALTGGRVDRPFLYRRCLSCGTSDWVMRAGRNEDETWRYWCVRCGDSFRTDLRIPHAAKPWIISAAVLTALIVGTVRLA